MSEVKYLVTADAATGVVKKVEKVGPSGELTEIPCPSFVPVGSHGGGHTVHIHYHVAGGYPYAPAPCPPTHPGMLGAVPPAPGWISPAPGWISPSPAPGWIPGGGCGVAICPPPGGGSGGSGGSGGGGC